MKTSRIRPQHTPPKPTSIPAEKATNGMNTPTPKVTARPLTRRSTTRRVTARTSPTTRRITRSGARVGVCVMTVLLGLVLAVDGVSAQPSGNGPSDASSGAGLSPAAGEPMPEERVESSRRVFPSIGLAAHIGWLHNIDRGRDPLFESDTVFQLGLSLDVIPWLDGVFFDRDRFRFGIAWNNLRTEDGATVYGVHSVDYTEHHILATADYGVHVLDWLIPYIEVGAGFGMYDLEIATIAAETQYAFSGLANIGVELAVDFAVDFGVRFEAGTTIRQEPDFTLSRDDNTPEDETPIPVEGVDIGTLPVNGFIGGIELFLRY